MKAPETISLFAEVDDNGNDLLESVLVRSLGNNQFELLCSPGLVIGLAAGDVFEPTAGGRFTVVSRGGNVCVQCYLATDIDMQASFEALLKDIGGRVDGRSWRTLVATIPHSAGFPSIERVMKEFTDAHPGTVWSYGNVYEDDDGQIPMSWWHDKK